MEHRFAVLAVGPSRISTNFLSTKKTRLAIEISSRKVDVFETLTDARETSRAVDDDNSGCPF